MHNPPHPGEVLRDLYLAPMGWTVKEAAQAIGISRTALSTVVNGHARLTVALAARLAAALRTSPELWLRLQLARDLWDLQQSKRPIRVRPIVSKRRASA